MMTNVNLRLLSRLAWGGFGAAIVLGVVAMVVSGIPGANPSAQLFVLAAIAFVVGLNSQIARIAVRAVLDQGGAQ